MPAFSQMADVSCRLEIILPSLTDGGCSKKAQYTVGLSSTPYSLPDYALGICMWSCNPCQDHKSPAAAAGSASESLKFAKAQLLGCWA